MSHCNQEMDHFCREEAQKRFISKKKFSFRSAREKPICETFSSNVKQLLNGQRLVLLQPSSSSMSSPLRNFCNHC
ncbi:hypothetical protein TNCV_1463661 [Trichonephila clavipes]|nr:hypothetical protein TNCV_1463661 [Trichonephila clavipes]